MNDLGQAVGSSYFAFLGDRAVMWDNDAAHTPVDFGVLPGHVPSSALAANIPVRLSASAPQRPASGVRSFGRTV